MEVAHIAAALSASHDALAFEVDDVIVEIAVLGRESRRYAFTGFLESLGCDLLMEWIGGDYGGALSDVFSISATNTAYVERAIGPQLRDALVELGGSYETVEVTDDCVRFGPLRDDDSDAAHIHRIARAIAAQPDLAEVRYAEPVGRDEVFENIERPPDTEKNASLLRLVLGAAVAMLVIAVVGPTITHAFDTGQAVVKLSEFDHPDFQPQSRNLIVHDWRAYSRRILMEDLQLGENASTQTKGLLPLASATGKVRVVLRLESRQIPPPGPMQARLRNVWWEGVTNRQLEMFRQAGIPMAEQVVLLEYIPD